MGKSDQLSTVRHIAVIANALDGARDYFADRADVKGDNGDIPNTEMSLQIEVEQAQASLASLRSLVVTTPHIVVNNDEAGEPHTMRGEA